MRIIKKNVITAIVLCLVLVLSTCLSSSTIIEQNETSKTSTVVFTVDEATKTKELFDYYEQEVTDNFSKATAFKNIKGAEISGIENASFNNNEELRTAYDVEYDYESEMVYLTISIFDSNEDLVSVQCMEAYPIVSEEGEIDALFEIDGKNIYMSEILSGSNENCFFFSLAMSLLAAKIVAATIVAAKVVVAVTAVVTVGYVTYKVAELTKAKATERERTAAKQKTKSNPKVYYPATRKQGKLLIAASPIGLIAASKAIVAGSDFWTPLAFFAKKLAIKASGGCIGPEVDSKRDGHYYHYHLLGRYGGHAFYGNPLGGKF